ncbi:class I SAM-dependent methyltransferase [Henriciella aquimarina]|uniref:class I SAM-dependent methyltransferase n=1 Tax=Henriciella aquimarina TaxID=545261 RepID=UPI000A002C9A|nr:methyltransferase domain-containing protein [Henriciella aquimarina]
MRLAASDLDAFYASRLGEAAVFLMMKRMGDLWGDCTGLNVLGMGHARPLLSGYAGTAKACISTTPHLGAETAWAATDRGVSTCLVDEDRLPFGDGTFERIILLHAIEEADSPRAVLREAWRVLAPEGRVLIAVANRKGLWSLFENTPFGHGRPWTRRQLIAYLNDHLFQVTASTTAVHVPPIQWGPLAGGAEGWERVGELFVPGFGGVVMVEAVKRLYARPGGGAAAPVTELAGGRKGAAQLPRKEAEVKSVEKHRKSRVDASVTARFHQTVADWEA